MKFLVPGAISAAAGALLGAIAVVAVTFAVAQNTRPDVDHGDGSVSLYNQVEYGQR